jgi:non-ribosomal peptide synthetase component F
MVRVPEYSLPGQEYLTQIDMIRNELGTVGQFVCIDSDAPGWGWIGLCEWGSSETGAVADRIDRTDPDAVQMYTSGTTGKPKGVVLTQQSLISTFERICRLVTEFFSRFVPEDALVLDLGCGYGEFINNVRCRERYGMDLNSRSGLFGPRCRSITPGLLRILESSC